MLVHERLPFSPALQAGFKTMLKKSRVQRKGTPEKPLNLLKNSEG